MAGSKVPRDPSISQEFRRFLDDLSRSFTTQHLSVGATRPTGDVLSVVPNASIAGTDSKSVSQSYQMFSDDGLAPFIVFMKSRADKINEHTVVQDGNGTGTLFFCGSDGTNFEVSAIIEAEIDGTPGNDDMPGRLLFYTTGDGSTSAAERLRIDKSGNIVCNTAAIATNATDGFLYVPTCAGTPTGTPTTYTGRAPIVVDTTNNRIYFYSGGAWRNAGP